MKYIIYCIISLATACLWGIACKKETIETRPLASLKIVNAIAGGSRAVLGSYNTKVANNGSANFTLQTGNTDVYVWPEGDSLHPYYQANKSVLVAESDIYTLFLSGTSAAPEGILIKEELPYRSDSTAGIRFVHLSPNGPAVNVTLSKSTDVNEFANISYKGITEFKSFPATLANTSYTFQVRDATTNDIFTSITMSGAALTSFVPRFRNVTIVFRGMVGGSPAPGITRVNHY